VFNSVRVLLDLGVYWVFQMQSAFVVLVTVNTFVMGPIFINWNVDTNPKHEMPGRATCGSCGSIMVLHLRTSWKGILLIDSVSMPDNIC